MSGDASYREVGDRTTCGARVLLLKWNAGVTGIRELWIKARRRTALSIWDIDIDRNAVD